MNKLVAIAFSLCLGITLSGCSRCSSDEERAEGLVDGKVKVELYVMSRCPYASQVENNLASALKKLPGHIDLRLEYIGDESDGKLSSLHGEEEVQGNMLQLCARKLYPQGHRYLDLIVCMNRDVHDIPGNWRGCALELGLDARKLEECLADDGPSLWERSAAKAKKKGAVSSPTLYIHHKLFVKQRTEQSFLQAICEALEKDEPEACASLPRPVEVAVTILSDPRCKSCRPEFWKNRVKALLPGARTSVLDYGSAEGKALFSALALSRLPAVYLEKTVERAEGFERLSAHLLPREAGYLLDEQIVRPDFDPTRELCEGGQDEDGDGKSDCADPDCAGSLSCRKENPGQLRLFLQWASPFNSKSLATARRLAEGGRLPPLSLWLLPSKNPEGSPSEPPPAEARCAARYLGEPQELFAYVSCLAGDRTLPCDDIQKKAAPKLAPCLKKGEGAKLLEQTAREAAIFGVTDSPTWVVNEKYLTFVLDEQGLTAFYCQHNPKARGCG